MTQPPATFWIPLPSPPVRVPGVAEVTGSNPVEAPMFSGFFLPIVEIGKFTAMITLHFPIPSFNWRKVLSLGGMVHTAHANDEGYTSGLL